MKRSRTTVLLLLLALLVAVGSAGTGASRISIVNDAADESVAIRPAFDYPWAGFRSVFSVSGFQQAANDLRSIVENAISHIRIDKISGSIGTPIHVDIDYDLYNIKLSGWHFGQLSTQVVSDPAVNDGVVRVHLDEISFRVDLDFHYSALLISGGGDASVNVILNMDIDLVFLNRGGEPQVYAGSVNPNLQKFDVSVHGGASWFYGVFVDIFKGKIKDAFVSALKQQVTNAISDINQQYVASFPVKTAVNDVVGINYALVYEPVNPYIASFGAVTNHVGRFYWLNGTANCPYPSGEMIPDLEQLGDRNLQLLAHESFITSVGCAYLAAGKLALTLDQSSIPPNFPVQLNTTYWQFFLPNLYFKFPNAGMKFEVVGTSPPVTTIGTTALGETMTFNTTCYAILSDGTTVPAFTLGTDVSIGFTVALAKGNLTANFGSFKVGLSLLASVIGTFDVALLQTVADFVVSDIFMPILNGYGREGIPLAYISSKSLTLSNTTLSFRPHYVVVSTDFNINLDPALAA